MTGHATMAATSNPTTPVKQNNRRIIKTIPFTGFRAPTAFLRVNVAHVLTIVYNTLFPVSTPRSVSNTMYIGRIVCIAMTNDSRLCAMYRVSSRSFPNRTATMKPDTVSIVPKAGFETDVQRNPYIAYNCIRIIQNGMVCVASNGSHTDPIAEKIALGMPVRDAMVGSLLALDYEKDQYNTPRIGAVVDKRDGSGWLGIVRDDGIAVRRMLLAPGRFWHVATYEEVHPSDHHAGEFPASNAETACDFILSGGIFAERENPISAVAAVASDDGFEMAVKDVNNGSNE